MKIDILHGHTFPEAQGVCVVIDVLRAFTTAAFAFDAGAREITLVATVEEAFKRRQKDPELLLMGEVGGVKVPGFNFGNSPIELKMHCPKGARLTQRTSSGTQGVIGCSHATHILLSSFVVAGATLKKIRALNPEHVSLIATGLHDGSEDIALAEYLRDQLLGIPHDAEKALDRVRNSRTAKRMVEGPNSYAEGAKDIVLATQLDLFSFPLEVKKVGNELVVKT